MSESTDERGELVSIGGLWANKDQNGNTYLAGYFGEARLLVFKNTFKKRGDKQPIYRMYVARKAQQEDADFDVDADPTDGESNN